MGNDKALDSLINHIGNDRYKNRSLNVLNRGFVDIFRDIIIYEPGPGANAFKISLNLPTFFGKSRKEMQRLHDFLKQEGQLETLLEEINTTEITIAGFGNAINNRLMIAGHSNMDLVDYLGNEIPAWSRLVFSSVFGDATSDLIVTGEYTLLYHPNLDKGQEKDKLFSNYKFNLKDVKEKVELLKEYMGQQEFKKAVTEHPERVAYFILVGQKANNFNEIVQKCGELLPSLFRSHKSMEYSEMMIKSFRELYEREIQGKVTAIKKLGLDALKSSLYTKAIYGVHRQKHTIELDRGIPSLEHMPFALRSIDPFKRFLELDPESLDVLNENYSDINPRLKLILAAEYSPDQIKEITKIMADFGGTSYDTMDETKKAIVGTLYHKIGSNEFRSLLGFVENYVGEGTTARILSKKPEFFGYLKDEECFTKDGANIPLFIAEICPPYIEEENRYDSYRWIAERTNVENLEKAKKVIQHFNLGPALEEGLTFSFDGVSHNANNIHEDMTAICTAFGSMKNPIAAIERYGADMFRMEFQRSPSIAIYKVAKFNEKK